VARSFDYILDNYTLVLCKYIIKEVENVFLEKFPYRINEMKRFMGRISYKLFELEEKTRTTYPEIRDIDDFPVLVNAIESNVDILITGDKDFDEILLKKPLIMKPRKFIDEYIS
jgi:predicted nucleic acid-binding protein